MGIETGLVDEDWDALAFVLALLLGSRFVSGGGEATDALGFAIVAGLALEATVEAGGRVMAREEKD